LRGGLLTAGALALGPAYYERAFAAGPVTVGPGPYGPPGPFDANGIALPKGFTSREIARGGMPVAGSAVPYTYHNGTDGQATFPTLAAGGKPDGGWILVANSEVPVPGGGGVSGIEFAPDGQVERAYRVLVGTTSNCAGGPTPWGTWLSCEEYDGGRVWECDPTGATPGIPRPALGFFNHEAVSVDPVNERLYLTEDKGDGCFYRFTPTDYPDLSAGLLEVALVDRAGVVTWARVPDPTGGGGPVNPTRSQVPGAAKFKGGEGTWYDDGIVYFTTKGDNRVYAFHIGPSRMDILYDKNAIMPEPPLSGVDNITVSPSGDIYVCEDGGDLDICLITSKFEISRFLKLDPKIHAGPPEPNPLKGNETVGVVFNPAGDRMYFGAQRSFAVGSDQTPAGVVYEVRGPFRKRPSAASFEARLNAQKRIRIPKYLRRGLPIRVSLDEPAGLVATLRVSVRGSGGKRRTVKIGAGKTNVAVRGRAALAVKPTKRGRKVLRGRKSAKGKLTVIATSGSGRRTVLHRQVVLFKPRRG